MVRTFEVFQNIFRFFKWRQSQVPRRHLERFSRRLLGGQAEAQEMIDDLFERIAGTPLFFLEQLGDVFIESKCGSHIMML